MKKKDIGNRFGHKAQSFEHRVAIFGANNLELNESPRLRSNRRWNVETYNDLSNSTVPHMEDVMRMRSSGLLSQNCSMVQFHYGENLEIGDDT